MPALQWLRYIANPFDSERQRALFLRRKWFPPAQQTPDQAIGRYVVACGATHGINEACNFGCTACYLGQTANRQKPLPFAAVQKQLRNLRSYLGPGGNVQITSGEVTLLPCQDLVNIVRFASELGLSPMVMTHGDVLLGEPGYLDRLVTEGKLKKIAFHVDLTQRGRRGWNLPKSELELNQVRDQMAALLDRCRKRTGTKLRAATTMTVNRKNLHQLRDPVTWFLKNLKAFRIMSLQPEATTGRTPGGNGVSAQQVWTELEAILNMKLNPHPFRFGHEACNRLALFMALEGGKGITLIQAVRPGNSMDRKFVDRLLDQCGGLVFSGKKGLEGCFKVFGLFLRRPSLIFNIAWYGFKRAWQERRLIASSLGDLLLGRLKVRFFAFVVHAFMGEEELKTAMGQERLQACVFKVPVNGEMVSMCAMNGMGIRDTTYPII